MLEQPFSVLLSDELQAALQSPAAFVAYLGLDRDSTTAYQAHHEGHAGLPSEVVAHVEMVADRRRQLQAALYVIWSTSRRCSAKPPRPDPFEGPWVDVLPVVMAIAGNVQAFWYDEAAGAAIMGGPGEGLLSISVEECLGLLGDGVDTDELDRCAE